MVLFDDNLIFRKYIWYFCYRHINQKERGELHEMSFAYAELTISTTKLNNHRLYNQKITVLSQPSVAK